ncbi:MAG: DUF6468 domain-containing protein [Alphaproteobacteria bacterium]|nr:DUF6468 domain-containing protein [Alphaproteobacteria bacterium]
MIFALLKVVLDLFVLGALGIALYYGLRLTRALETFRNARGELAQIVVQLNRHIEEAHKAVEGLRAASAESGEHLQKTLKEARTRAEELELMNAAGNSLARRLEGLAERNRRMAQGLGDEDLVFGMEQDEYEQQQAGFSIHDRDYGQGSGGDYEQAEETSLGSRAERELYEALRGKSGTSRKG